MDIICKVYKKQNLLAEGFSSQVFKGSHIHKKQHVAIKIAKDPNCISLFEEELRILQQIRFQGVPRLIKRNLYQGLPVLVFELLGTTLEQQIQQNNFSLSQIYLLAHFLLKTLQDLHRQGYTHNDIKPNNIMFGRKRSQYPVYLIDFGFAHNYRNNLDWIKYSFKGNYKYCSMESLVNPRKLPKDDLESLCYVLIELAVGQLPWSSYNSKNQLIRYKQSLKEEQILEGAPVILKEF